MSDFENQSPSFAAVYTTALEKEPSLVSTPVLGKNDEVLELGDNFSLGDFQVVRREFFAHLSEPSITFNSYKFYVNKACLNKFPHADYAIRHQRFFLQWGLFKLWLLLFQPASCLQK